MSANIFFCQPSPPKAICKFQGKEKKLRLVFFHKIKILWKKFFNNCQANFCAFFWRNRLKHFLKWFLFFFFLMLTKLHFDVVTSFYYIQFIFHHQPPPPLMGSHNYQFEIISMMMYSPSNTVTFRRLCTFICGVGGHYQTIKQITMSVRCKSHRYAHYSRAKIIFNDKRERERWQHQWCFFIDEVYIKISSYDIIYYTNKDLQLWKQSQDTITSNFKLLA